LETLSNRLKEEKITLEKLTTQSNEKESIYKNLVDNTQRLKNKVQHFEDLERQVKEGKLIELEEENNRLSESLKSEEDKFNSLKAERDNLLQKQLTQQDHIQKIIKQTELVGNTDELFREFEEKCKTHNEKMLQNQLDEVEQHKGFIEGFSDKDIYTDKILTPSIQQKLDKAKKMLDEVDAELNARL